MNALEGARAARRGRRLASGALALALAAVFWGALWTRLDQRSVLTRVPVLDEAHYLREAQAIAAGRLAPATPFVMSPLYPYFVAATGGGRDFNADGVRQGPPPHGTRLAQALLWLGVIGGLRVAARRLLDDPYAWIPPALCALYAPAAVFVTTTLLEIPFVFCLTTVLVLLTPGPAGVAPAVSRSWRVAAGAGLLIGAATLLRPTALLLLLPAWLAVGASRRVRPPLVALLAGTLACLLPVVAHNSLRAGRLAGVSLNGGLNFYIGQGPGANGFFRSFEGFQFEADPAGVTFLSGRLGRPVDGPGEADRIWFAHAWAAVREHPARALGLWARKAWLHFTAPEIDQVTPLSVWKRDGPPLRLLVVPYGLLSALGLAGLVLVARRPAWRPWLLTLGLLVAAQSAFFVVSRYRLALVPSLALLAAAWAGELSRRRGRARLWPAVLALAGALVVVPWGLGAQRAAWNALGGANEARRWARLGDPEGLARAETLYRESLEADPTQVAVYQGLARVLVRREQVEEALRVLAAGALRVDQGDLLERDLAMLHMQQARYDEALPRLLSYRRDHPDDAEVLHALAVALQGTGRTAEAIEASRRLVALRPDDPQGYVNLGVLLARTGRAEEARGVFEAGLRRCPDSASLRRNLQVLGAAGAGARTPPSVDPKGEAATAR